jgi:hypothetical protein
MVFGEWDHGGSHRYAGNRLEQIRFILPERFPVRGRTAPEVENSFVVNEIHRKTDFCNPTT